MTEETTGTPVSPERTLREVPVIFFDIDGVITDPKTKMVQETYILEAIAANLEKGYPQVLATGRSLDFVRDRVLAPLEALATDRSKLNNLFISGEFGGSNIEYVNGVRHEFIDPNVSVPQTVLDKAKEITLRYGSTMATDETKKTQYTSEMHDGLNADEEFRQMQTQIIPEYQKVVDEEGLSDELEVHADRIATNIRRKGVNKHTSIKESLEWLKKKGMKPGTIQVFGDSLSDLEMADELNSQGYSFTMVFVGDAHMLEGIDKPYKIENYPGTDSATAQYLRTHPLS